MHNSKVAWEADQLAAQESSAFGENNMSDMTHFRGNFEKLETILKLLNLSHSALNYLAFCSLLA